MNLDGLLRIVGDVLAIEPPAASDNFFDIGGSSLAAIRLLARFEQQYGFRISPRDFLACPTLGDVTTLTAERDSKPLIDGPSVASFGPVPAGLAQQWALDAERLDPGAPALQSQAAFRLTGALDLDSLRSALRDVQSHHEALGVRFVRVGDRDMMETVAADPTLLVEDLPLTDAAREDAWRSRLDEFARLPFPAEGSERWRTLVIRHASRISTICFAFDHRTADGWSLGIIFEDLAICYAARCKGEEPALIPAGSWFEYVTQERADLPYALTRALEHWRPRLPESFADYPVEIPGRLAAPELSEPRILHLDLPKGAASALDRRGRTPFVVATAALARAVSAANGMLTVRILTSSANRRHPGHERTVGWFATGVFPTYLLSPQGDWEADLDEVAAESQAALSVGDVPAVYVRRGLWPDSPAGFRQDTGLYLACNDALDAKFRLAGLSAEPVNTPDRADSPGIQLFLGRTSTGWSLTCYFHEKEYPGRVVEALANAFVDQLTTLSGSTKED